MKVKALFSAMAIVMALLFVGTTGVMAASVEPYLITDWKSGDAAFECDQIQSGSDFAFKKDFEENTDPSGTYEGDGPDGKINYITINANIVDGEYKSFDWKSSPDFPVTAVIVKAGNSVYVYWYGGEFTDTNLVAPDDKGISHVTFCYNYVPGNPVCYKDETAWVVGDRYVKKGNWAMYYNYKYDSGATVPIRADGGDGVGINAGIANFSPPIENLGKYYVNISITLANGCIFYYDILDPYYDNNLKVQDYSSTPPKLNPAPGRFDWKTSIPTGDTTGSIMVPLNTYYGVHMDVACPVACE